MYSLVLISYMLASCAWITSNPATANLIVNQLTHRVIAEAEDPQKLAAKVVIVVDLAKVAVDQNPDISLDVLQSLILKHAAVNEMAPADRDLVVLLVDQLLVEAESRINDIERNVDQMTALRDVLSTVRRAAKSYEGD